MSCELNKSVPFLHLSFVAEDCSFFQVIIESYLPVLFFSLRITVMRELLDVAHRQE
jgi:hypothetical protein